MPEVDANDMRPISHRPLDLADDVAVPGTAQGNS